MLAISATCSFSPTFWAWDPFTNQWHLLPVKCSHLNQ
uniref:Uncharacterized protein n=1 Tax=Rhizophora mucronata TaxID=61149 RepID=A0A2P2K8K6_RHIMU